MNSANAVVLKARWTLNQGSRLGRRSRNSDELMAKGTSTPHAMKANTPYASYADMFGTNTDTSAAQPLDRLRSKEDLASPG